MKFVMISLIYLFVFAQLNYHFKAILTCNFMIYFIGSFVGIVLFFIVKDFQNKKKLEIGKQNNSKLRFMNKI